MIKRTLVPAIVPTLLLTASTATAAPMDDWEAPNELLQLRDELAFAGPAWALEDQPSYAALCDDEGFPLVGNAVPKDWDAMQQAQGMLASGFPYQPSQFCRDVNAPEEPDANASRPAS